MGTSGGKDVCGRGGGGSGILQKTTQHNPQHGTTTKTHNTATTGMGLVWEYS